MKRIQTDNEKAYTVVYVFLLNYLNIFGIILLVSIYNNVQIKILGNKYSSFFGYSTFEVQTGSMADTINPGDWIKKIDNMPDVAIACFSDVLFNSIVHGGKCLEIGRLHNTNGYKSIYEIEYKGKRLAIFMMAVGAPAAVADIEDIHQMGSNKIVVFGNCGVLDNTIDDCSVIIPNRALRDEGTSFHYMEPSKDIVVNKKYVSQFKEIVEEFGYKYTEGVTWTTDAFYRETRDIVNKRCEDGAIVVEMEASALQAVADFREFDFFTFFHTLIPLKNKISRSITLRVFLLPAQECVK